MKGIDIMDEKIIDMEVTYKSKWEKFKHKAWTKKEKFVNWVKEKPQEAAIVGSVVIVGADKLFKGIKKLKELQPTQAELDREWREHHVYDRSLGMYFPLKRKMSPRECMNFEQRKKRGESTGDILRSMNLLKR